MKDTPGRIFWNCAENAGRISGESNRKVTGFCLLGRLVEETVQAVGNAEKRKCVFQGIRGKELASMPGEMVKPMSGNTISTERNGQAIMDCRPMMIPSSGPEKKRMASAIDVHPPDGKERRMSRRLDALRRLTAPAAYLAMSNSHCLRFPFELSVASCVGVGVDLPSSHQCFCL